MSTKVLLTGGAGYLGRGILRRRANSLPDWDVTVFSRDETKQDECRRRYPDVRYVLGDVRDIDHLQQVMTGHDLVVHAAAVKYIDAAELNASECVSVNVGGSQAIARAAWRADVQRVVGISTDKACVDYFGLVEMADGTSRRIAHLVRDHVDGSVRTVSDAGLDSAPITGWHKNPRAGREMVRLGWAGAYKHRGQSCATWFTVDHPVLTVEGWRPAGEIHTGDLLVTSTPAPNPKHTELLIGTLLGDASIRGRMFSVGHAESQLEWLELKRDALAALKPGVVQWQARRNPRHQAFGTFKLKTSAALETLQHAFYGGGRKRPPRELIEKHFSALLLAAWYLDDGCIDRSKGNHLARLSTHGFSREDVEWLADFLTIRGFTSYLSEDHVAGKDYYGLRFRADGSRRLYEVIGAYVPPALRYKLPAWATPFDASLWNLGSAVPHVAPAVREDGQRLPRRKVYCLDVAGTHNFAVGGLIAHNCQPVNIYGASKMVMERLFAESSTPTTTFTCVRYGNVVGSTGSVIPLFQRQYAEMGRVRVTNPKMTRFWMSVDQAIDLILTALTEARPGAVVVPYAEAMSLVDVARAATVDDVPVDVIGERPGEKVAELLLHHEESVRVRRHEGWLELLPPGTPPDPGIVADPRPFTIASHTPHHWMTVDAMRGLIADAATV